MKEHSIESMWDENHRRIPREQTHSEYAESVEPLFPRSAVVCDVGGGAGRDAVFFAQKGHEVSVVDISGYALTSARAKAESLKIDIRTHKADLEQDALPFEDGYADVVYARMAIQYFDKDTTISIIREIYRILKSGGQAFITAKSPDDADEIGYLKEHAEETMPGVFKDKDGKVYSRFALDGWKGILDACGIAEYEVRNIRESMMGKSVQSGAEELVLVEIRFTK